MQERILVHAPNWIGDQLLAYPFFFALRKIYPKSRIAAIARNWVAKIQFTNLIDHTFVDDETLLTRLKQESWDRAFVLPNSFSSAWKVYRAGAKERIGYAGEWRSLLLSKALRAHDGHRALQYLDLLQDSKIDSEKILKESMAAFDPAEVWNFSGEVSIPKGDYWILAPGSQAESRRWGEGSFQLLADRIHEETGMAGYILGGEGERPVAHRLASRRESGLVNYCAQFPLSDLPQIFKGARFTICNDSGLAHLSALCGTPTHIVWGAGNPDHTKPLGPGPVTLHQRKVPCWPCEKNKCKNSASEYLRCLREQSPDEVFRALQSSLKK